MRGHFICGQVSEVDLGWLERVVKDWVRVRVYGSAKSVVMVDGMGMTRSRSGDSIISGSLPGSLRT